MSDPTPPSESNTGLLLLVVAAVLEALALGVGLGVPAYYLLAPR